jgi:hypothetical protein
LSTNALRAGPLKALLRNNAARYKGVMFERILYPMIEFQVPEVKIVINTSGFHDAECSFVVVEKGYYFGKSTGDVIKWNGWEDEEIFTKKRERQGLHILRLHHAAIQLGVKINPLNSLLKGGMGFSENIIHYEECHTHHCLAVKLSGEFIHIKNGLFLDDNVSDKKTIWLPECYSDFESKDHLKHNIYEFILEADKFWRLYHDGIELWNTHFPNT